MNKKTRGEPGGSYLQLLQAGHLYVDRIAAARPCRGERRRGRALAEVAWLREIEELHAPVDAPSEQSGGVEPDAEDVVGGRAERAHLVGLRAAGTARLWRGTTTRRRNTKFWRLQRRDLHRPVERAGCKPEGVNTEAAHQLPVPVQHAERAAAGPAEVPLPHGLVGAQETVLVRGVERDAGHPILLAPPGHRRGAAGHAGVPEQERPVVAAREEGEPVPGRGRDRYHRRLVAREGAAVRAEALGVQGPGLHD